MGIGTLKNLRDVRERLVGYRAESVARIARIPMARLQQIETDQDTPTAFELEQLSVVYGIDYERLLNRPIRLAPGDIVEAFASLNLFHEIGDLQRFRIIEIANAARELRWLERLLEIPPASELARIAYDRGAAPYRQGAIVATKVRNAFGPPSGPIGSMRDYVRETFPQVRLFYAELGSEGLAGISFSDNDAGPVIALNLQGKNRNPAVRRFSLAHDLGHLFMDRPRGKPLAVLSGYQTEVGLETERRVNAFAIRLLCPEQELASLPADGLEAAEHLIRDYGMHYSAARLYLWNERSISLAERVPEQLVVGSFEHIWEDAEKPYGLTEFPLNRVPFERRTPVAARAAQAYSLGRISRNRFAELLRVPPTDEVEQVLDFFALAGC
jgi:hypothetical protein